MFILANTAVKSLWDDRQTCNFCRKNNTDLSLLSLLPFFYICYKQTCVKEKNFTNWQIIEKVKMAHFHLKQRRDRPCVLWTSLKEEQTFSAASKSSLARCRQPILKDILEFFSPISRNVPRPVSTSPCSTQAIAWSHWRRVLRKDILHTERHCRNKFQALKLTASEFTSHIATTPPAFQIGSWLLFHWAEVRLIISSHSHRCKGKKNMFCFVLFFADSDWNSISA